MTVLSSSYIMLVASLIGVKSQSPVVTDSGWSDFQCFVDAELEEYRQPLTIDDGKVDVYGELTIINDDYSLPSLVAAILQRDLYGVNVALWDFYQDAGTFVNFITNANERTVANHRGILKQDFVPPAFGLVRPFETLVSSQTTWAMQSEVVRDVKQEINDLGDGDECELFMDEWRAFTKDEVIGTMDNASMVVIPSRDDGSFACSQQHGCWHEDSTWYPPRCANGTGECMVLLQFLPEHDLELNRDLILNCNLSIVIKYMGSPRTHYGQTNFRTFYEGNYRVIFQLRSMDFVSADAFGWETIVLPADEAINDNQPVVRLFPEQPKNLESLSKVQRSLAFQANLEKSDIDWIHEKIFRATNDGSNDETKDIRMRAACDWVKSSGGKAKWQQWLLQDDGRCNDVDDHILQILDIWTADDLWIINWVDPKTEAHRKLAQSIDEAVMDSWTAVYLKRQCITDPKERNNVAVLIFGYSLAAFAAALLIVVTIATCIWWRQEIIMSSSLNLIAAQFMGALFALSVVLFSEIDMAGHCILRMYIVQIGCTLMFGPLVVKIWKLSAIHENIKLLRTTDITEKVQLVRIGIALLLITGFLFILTRIFPMEVRMSIVKGERTTMCEWDGSAETAYNVLLMVEALGLFIVARTAWCIQSVNPQHNEHKWTGSSLFGAVVIIIGYLIVGLWTMNSTTIIVRSMLISVLVMMVISLLMMPKFRIIWLDEDYQPDSFEHDSISFASSLLTKRDLKRMRSLLREQGYRVIKKDCKGNVVESSASGSGWSRGLSRGLTRLWGKRPRSSTNLSSELTEVSDVQVSVTR